MKTEINWEKAIAEALPYALRKPKIIALLLVCIKPLIWLHKLFIKGKKGDDTRLKYNGQVCHLRGVLEESFGKGFIIRDKQQTIIRPVFAYQESDQRCVLTYKEPDARIPITTITNVEQDDTFIVLVPAHIYQSRLSEVIDLINQYKLPSKSFQCISL